MRACSIAMGCLLAALSVCAQPSPSPAANHVLELDGTNSFIELPGGSLTNLTEVTVEGWVKWQGFGSMSRFFDFTLAGYSLNAQNRGTNSTLHVEAFRGDNYTTLTVPGILSLGSWTHVAVTFGTNGVQLFVNSALVATDATTGQFSTTGLEKRNYLGRSNFRAVYTTDADLHGQIDEVRVWEGVRTEAQIRENMFKNLTGKEAGLAGLWNFDKVEKGVVKDSASGRHEGRLVGNGRTVAAQLPAALES